MEAVWFSSSSGVRSVSEAISHGVHHAVAKEIFKCTSDKAKYSPKRLPRGIVPILSKIDFGNMSHIINEIDNYDGPYTVASKVEPLTTYQVDWYWDKDVSGFIMNAKEHDEDDEIKGCDSMTKEFLLGTTPCFISEKRFKRPQLTNDMVTLRGLGYKAMSRVIELGYSLNEIPEQIRDELGGLTDEYLTKYLSHDTKLKAVGEVVKQELELSDIQKSKTYTAMNDMSVSGYEILRAQEPMKVLFTDENPIESLAPDVVNTNGYGNESDDVPMFIDKIDAAYIDEYTSNIVRKIILYTGVIYNGDSSVYVPNERNIPSLLWKAHDAIVANHIGSSGSIIRNLIEPNMRSIETRFAENADKAYKKLMVVFTVETIPILTTLLATKLHDVILSVLWESRDAPAYRIDMAVTRISGKFNYNSILSAFMTTLERIVKETKSWLSRTSVMKEIKSMKIPEWAMDVEHEIIQPPQPSRRVIDESINKDSMSSIRKPDDISIRTISRKSNENMHMMNRKFVRSMGDSWSKFSKTMFEAGYPAISSVARILGPSVLESVLKVRKILNDDNISEMVSTIMTSINENKTDRKKIESIRQVEENFRLPSRDKIAEAREQKRETRKGIILDQINKADGAERVALINLRKEDLWTAAGLEEYDMPKEGQNAEHETPNNADELV